MSSINREAFLRALNVVQPGITAREFIEQSSCFVFKNGQVVTFNDEICCRCDIGIDPAITGAVPAKPLVSILQKLPEDEVDVTSDGTQLIVKGKRRGTKIRLERQIFLPFGEAVSLPEKWKKLPSGFLDGIKVVVTCVSDDQTTGELTCVHVHTNWLEATDRYQAIRFDLQTKVSAPLLVRGEAVKYVVPLDVTEFGDTAEWLSFRSGVGIIVSCRKYVQSFKDISKYFDPQGKKIQLPNGLKEAVEKAEIFSKNPDENLVTVELGQNKLKIKGQGIEGYYWEHAKIVYDGPPMTFSISAEVLKRIAEKHSEVVVSETKLYVVGDCWVYATGFQTAKKEGDGE